MLQEIDNQTMNSKNIVNSPYLPLLYLWIQFFKLRKFPESPKKQYRNLQDFECHVESMWIQWYVGIRWGIKSPKDKYSSNLIHEHFFHNNSVSKQKHSAKFCFHLQTLYPVRTTTITLLPAQHKYECRCLPHSDTRSWLPLAEIKKLLLHGSHVHILPGLPQSVNGGRCSQCWWIVTAPGSQGLSPWPKGHRDFVWTWPWGIYTVLLCVCLHSWVEWPTKQQKPGLDPWEQSHKEDWKYGAPQQEVPLSSES